MLSNKELNNRINNAKQEIQSILKKLEDDANITVTDIRISEIDVTSIADTARKTIRSIKITVIIYLTGQSLWLFFRYAITT